MNSFRLRVRRQVQAHGRSVLMTCVASLLLIVQASQAAPPVASPDKAPRLKPAGLVNDVAIGPDGILWGRVIDTSGGSTSRKAVRMSVRFSRGKETLVTVATDHRGRFGLRNLPLGLYQVVVEGTDPSSGRLYVFRVWDSRAAPPGAQREMCLQLGTAVIRGQYPTPFPFTSLGQAAIVSGITVGAIAAPVIYHNARLDNRVPATKQPGTP